MISREADQQRIATIREMHRDGLGHEQIARALNICEGTVRRALRITGESQVSRGADALRRWVLKLRQA